MARGNGAPGQTGAELLAGYRASGLTRKAYCEEMGISISRLGYYVRREGEKARKQAKMLPVEVVAANSSSPLTLVFGSGMRLEVSAGFDEVTLRRLLAVVA